MCAFDDADHDWRIAILAVVDEDEAGLELRRTNVEPRQRRRAQRRRPVREDLGADRLIQVDLAGPQLHGMPSGEVP